MSPNFFYTIGHRLQLYKIDFLLTIWPSLIISHRNEKPIIIITYKARPWILKYYVNWHLPIINKLLPKLCIDPASLPAFVNIISYVHPPLFAITPCTVRGANVSFHLLATASYQVVEPLSREGFVGEYFEEGCVLFGMHFSQSKNARLLNSY